MGTQKHSADWPGIMRKALGSRPTRQKPSTGIVGQQIRATQSQKSIWQLHMPMALMCIPIQVELFIGLENLRYKVIAWLKTILVLHTRSVEVLIKIIARRYIGSHWLHRKIMRVLNIIWEAFIFEDWAFPRICLALSIGSKNPPNKETMRRKQY
ncbi:hypothetical protein BI364_08215 [Acidihalobacter yilgarnensis]|uniref:Uncharacterized protein n=1 Tax=Acidihalobacter yilgarnensis TaxID=2819280 RepID=A0A1D8INA9_9GAMM|nr:hypothetical protein BI364_08215 [Acidihalobacter yilgarnensis]